MCSSLHFNAELPKCQLLRDTWKPRDYKVIVSNHNRSLDAALLQTFLYLLGKRLCADLQLREDHAAAMTVLLSFLSCTRGGRHHPKKQGLPGFSAAVCTKFSLSHWALFPARHPPRDRLLQTWTEHCRPVLPPPPPLLCVALLSPEASFWEVRGSTT